MAIIIPSKHIYEKDNDKIRDNKIGKIEVGAVEIVPDNKFDTVIYNAKESTEIDSEQTLVSNETAYKCVPNWVDSWNFEYGTAVAQATFTTYYNWIELKIPKSTNKYRIAKLLEKDDDGDSKICANVYCTKKTGSVDVQSQIVYTIDGSNTLDPIKVQGVVPAQPTDANRNLSQGGTVLLQTIPDEIQASKDITVNTIKYTATATAKKYGYENEFFVTEDNDYYYVKCYLLVGVIYDRVSWSESVTGIDASTKEDRVKDISLKGTSEAYVPSYVEITFYGNTIGIDMNDKTVTINGDGTHPISFEGNELMQTTNYVKENGEQKDYITTAFGKTMDLYKNGKETATILCDIYNSHEVAPTMDFSYVQDTDQPKDEREFNFYVATENIGFENREMFCFDVSVGEGWDSIDFIVDNDKATDIDKHIDKVAGTIYCVGTVPKGTQTVSAIAVCKREQKYYANLHIVFDKAYEIDYETWLNPKDDYVSINGVTGFIQDGDDEFVHINFWSLTLAQIYALQKEVNTGLRYKVATKKLSFNIGDIVIPMTYGVNGVDKPMSKYKDGSPKKFQVQGVRVFYDGAVWQELTLQEFS